MTPKTPQSASGALAASCAQKSVDEPARTWQTDSSFSDEEQPMTLCIAADCWINDKPALAYCCDTRAERGGVFHELVGSEDAWKIREIGRNIALVSGSETPADRLLALCDATIKGFGTITGGDDSELFVDAFLRDLEAHTETRKKAIVDHWVKFEYAFSIEDFIRDQRHFDPDMVRQVWQRVRDTDLETDILICGFQDSNPVIVKLDRFGKAHWETNYSAIGSGSDIAYSFLSQHDWDEQPSLTQCAHYLLEAKTAAERNRHVGEYTYLQFLLPDGKRYELQSKTFDRLNDTVNRRRKYKALTFSMEMLEELKDDQ
jgi:hypothetical protein